MDLDFPLILVLAVIISGADLALDRCCVVPAAPRRRCARSYRPIRAGASAV